MIAIKAIEMRDNFKKYCDKAVAGETIIITRKDNKNVVVLSLDEYNAIIKAAKNADYLAMIDQSMAELQKGRLVAKTFEELREYEQ